METFDHRSFASRLESAVREAFQELAQAHPGEQLCAFALYSDSCGQTVCPSTNTRSHLLRRVTAEPDEAAYYQFGPAEWALEGRGATDRFSELCSELLNHPITNGDDEDLHERFIAELGETCISTLERLRAEGFFARVAGGPVTVLFQATPGDEEVETERATIARLNEPDVVEVHREWTESWGT